MSFTAIRDPIVLAAVRRFLDPSLLRRRKRLAYSARARHHVNLRRPLFLWEILWALARRRAASAAQRAGALELLAAAKLPRFLHGLAEVEFAKLAHDGDEAPWRGIRFRESRR